MSGGGRGGAARARRPPRAEAPTRSTNDSWADSLPAVIRGTLPEAASFAPPRGRRATETRARAAGPAGSAGRPRAEARDLACAAEAAWHRWTVIPDDMLRDQVRSLLIIPGWPSNAAYRPLRARVRAKCPTATTYARPAPVASQGGTVTHRTCRNDDTLAVRRLLKPGEPPVQPLDWLGREIRSFDVDRGAQTAGRVLWHSNAKTEIGRGRDAPQAHQEPRTRASGESPLSDGSRRPPAAGHNTPPKQSSLISRVGQPRRSWSFRVTRPEPPGPAGSAVGARGSAIRLQCRASHGGAGSPT